MDRREMLGLIGASTTVALAVPSVVAQDEKGRSKGKAHEGSKAADMINDCQLACDEAFHHCFEKISAGDKKYAKALHVTVDCAEICAATASLCARMSPLMAHACEACAKCCEVCLEECEKLNDSEMSHCVNSCRECAKVCRDIGKTHR